ncbi:MAG: acyl-CoA thioesterase [Rhodospirillum sp.]|nr:acyl-CoA thioesterase [Rhodospirillum sp.]MCF8489345.1 acyl-CoA thioesterase [Rhodospirillum sp.]MCF8500701.1 acyl-CoA thioesterase [Rhodospirillum sp.]
MSISRTPDEPTSTNGREPEETPGGILSTRAIAMPADTNPAGDIFGGWLMAQMDLAGGTHARKVARGRVATVAVNGFTFHKPVRVGDEVSCYTQVRKTGRTSVSIDVQAWVRRWDDGGLIKVTEGLFTFVALDGQGAPRALSDGKEGT